MLADNLYRDTEPGAEQTLTYHEGFGNPSSYETFVLELERLDELAEQGLIQITYQHKESQTGHHFVDVVRFKRIK